MHVESQDSLLPARESLPVFGICRFLDLPVLDLPVLSLPVFGSAGFGSAGFESAGFESAGFCLTD